LLQRGIAVLDRHAVALPGRFLPELGRSFGSGLFFGLSRARSHALRLTRAAQAINDAPVSLPKDCPVKYEIDYTFIANGSTKAEEIGTSADLVLGDEAGFGLIPNVGDYVDIPRSRMGERENYRGKVCHRLFRHVLGYCYVRIVVAEVDDAEWMQKFS
jgi:hypothetical protein